MIEILHAFNFEIVIFKIIFKKKKYACCAFKLDCGNHFCDLNFLTHAEYTFWNIKGSSHRRQFDFTLEQNMNFIKINMSNVV